MAVLGGCSSQAGGGSQTASKASTHGVEVDLDPAAIAKERGRAGTEPASSSGGRPQVVVAVPPGMASEQSRCSPRSAARSTGRRADAQIRKDLAEFRKYLSTIPPASGDRAEVTPEGQAAVPFVAPQVVATVVQAANEIAKTRTAGAAATARGVTGATTARGRSRSPWRPRACSTGRSPQGASSRTGHRAAASG